MRARRLLRKRQDRFASLYASLAVMSKTPDGQRHPGPARGLCEAATAIGAFIHSEDGKILVRFSWGVEVDILTPHGTFFSEMIRMAIRLTILETLQSRVANEERKDLKGIHAYVDRQATMALANSKWARGHDARASVDDKDADGGDKVGRAAPWRFQNGATLRRITSGSIRLTA